MCNNEKSQEKKCFIITPIGDEGSNTFRKAKGVIESVIKPILHENGFNDIKPAYEIMESGMIGNQVVNRIIENDLVIANLTGNNPNVMYELAIRHIIAKPVIHICETGTILPFDIKDSRTIFYSDDMLGAEELKNVFKKFVLNIDYSKYYMDNPICSFLDKLNNVFSNIGDSAKNADILIRLQSDDFQIEKLKTMFLDLIPDLVIIGIQKVGNIYLIYIVNNGNKDITEIATLLRNIGSKIGIKVFFIDNLKTNNKIFSTIPHYTL